MANLIPILLNIGSSLLTKKIVSHLLAVVIEWAVKSSKTPVDDKLAQPILEELRK